MQTIQLTGNSLNIEQVIEVAFHYQKISISEESLIKVRASEAYIQSQVEQDHIIYGVNTGFGTNASTIIKKEEAFDLQKNLLLSHATGVGKNFSIEIVRAIMLIRLNTLLAGYSGIREETVNLLCELINQKIHPMIPEQGSVGASGDLCPLSHMAITLLGEGYAEVDGKTLQSKEALAQRNLSPIQLSYKEGIALSNGTTVMAALGAIGIYESMKLLKISLLSSCLMFEGFGARKQAFDIRLHQVRRHEGQIQIAQWIADYTQNSKYIGMSAKDILCKIPQEILDKITDTEVQKELKAIIEGVPRKFSFRLYKYLFPESGLSVWQQWESIFSLAEKKVTPQDSYSIRCTPQVMGASLQAINHAKEVVENELNAVVDNPIIFLEEDEEESAVLSGGNFHGQPLALVLDYLKLSLAEIGNLLERQINKLVDPATNDKLPAFLVDKSGLHSGLMIPQYVAAGLVSENKVLVHPASADSIPTSANQEDHVSMGTIAGRQALEILENVKKITTILMFTSAQAIDIRKEQLAKINWEHQLGEKTQELYEKVREKIDYLEEDRFLHEDIKTLLESWEEFCELV